MITVLDKGRSCTFLCIKGDFDQAWPVWKFRGLAFQFLTLQEDEWRTEYTTTAVEFLLHKTILVNEFYFDCRIKYSMNWLGKRRKFKELQQSISSWFCPIYQVPDSHSPPQNLHLLHRLLQLEECLAFWSQMCPTTHPPAIQMHQTHMIPQQERRYMWFSEPNFILKDQSRGYLAHCSPSSSVNLMYHTCRISYAYSERIKILG